MFCLQSSVIDNPSNASTIDYYERNAKVHLDAYMKLLLQDPEKKPSNDLDFPGLIGQRLSRRKLKKKDTRKIPAKIAANFFEQLLASFHDFKNYCFDNAEAGECAVLDTDNAVLLDAMNEYDNLLNNHDEMYDKALGI